MQTAFCEGFEVPPSSHCTSALHLHSCLSAGRAVHMEWLHDHVRIERMLFEGAPDSAQGRISSNGAPGLGLSLKAAEAERFRIAFEPPSRHRPGWS